ncbi:MAG: hypothetical protein KJI71_03295 [Patescibacteria group bacterium]|nr:hypothetical protein [Patescibacteria group bacterium]
MNIQSQKGISLPVILVIIALVFIGAWTIYYGGSQSPQVQEDSMMEKKDTKIISLTLASRNDSGESGTATITEVDGKAKVTLTLSGAPAADISQPAHIHLNSCTDIGGIKYPLTDVTGSSETILDVSVEQILSELPLAINVHKSYPEIGVYVSCGNIVYEETDKMMKETESTQDSMVKEVDEKMMKEIMAMTYQYSGQLADVTNGETILGINTGGNSFGVANASFENGTYSLLVTFDNLPDPKGTDFYEGWIVRKGIGFNVISSGRVDKIDGVYTNTYVSGQDLTDHTFYVLTIEPDDGNPAPADHILEGTMVGQ